MKFIDGQPISQPRLIHWMMSKKQSHAAHKHKQVTERERTVARARYASCPVMLCRNIGVLRCNIGALRCNKACCVATCCTAL
jgi:hypothetical protein